MLSRRPIARYLPVILRDSVYVAEDYSFDVDDGMSEEELGPYIQKSHVPISTSVEIMGKRFSAIVFAAIDTSDQSYVAVDSESRPVDSPVDSDIPFLDQVQQNPVEVLHAESIVPPQRVNLRSFFVRPVFRDVTPSLARHKADVSWDECLNYSRAIISGAPGSGKTSCLRRLTLELSDRYGFSYRPNVVPVFVMLRHLDGDSLDFHSIASAAEAIGGMALPQALPDLANSGNLVLLLDGLDEVPDMRRSRVEQSIAALAARHSRLRILITTRDWTSRSLLDGFSRLQLQPFNDAQIREWSWNWLGSDAASARLCRHIAESPRVHNLVRNPLLLCLTASLYEQFSISPHDSGSLLSQFVNAMVETWDRMRGVHRRSEPWASPEVKLSTLCTIAFCASNEGRPEFSTAEARDWLATSLESVSFEDLMESLSSHTGLLQEVAPSKWSFTHKVLQEWLTAHYIVRSPLDVRFLLRNRLRNSSWRDTWTSACAITTDPSYLFALADDEASLTQGEKALMFADALCQQLRLSQGTVTTSCSVIVSALEHCFSALRLRRVEVGRDTTCRQWRFTLGEGSAPGHEDALERIDDLIRAVYRMRTSAASTTLRALLLESTSAGARSIAALLDNDGPLTLCETEYLSDSSLDMSVEVANPAT